MTTAPLIHCPIIHSVDIALCDPAETTPLVAALERDAVCKERATFPRGTLLPDGLLDLCKQSLARPSTSPFEIRSVYR